MPSRPLTIRHEIDEILKLEISGYSAVLEWPWLGKMQTSHPARTKLNDGSRASCCLLVLLIPDSKAQT